VAGLKSASIARVILPKGDRRRPVPTHCVKALSRLKKKKAREKTLRDGGAKGAKFGGSRVRTQKEGRLRDRLCAVV